jgi:hypothetical protein
MHTLDRSRFIIGDIIEERDKLGMHQVVGSVGTFSTFLASRAVDAVPDHPIPELSVQYFPNDAGQQDTEVMAYLTAAGMPNDQITIGATYPTVQVRVPIDSDGGIDIGDATSNTGWFSRLARTCGNVPIVDSFASAILEGTGASVEEEVYWPTVGADVVAKLSAFQSLLNDSQRRQAYVALLPTSVGAGQLVIHHTKWNWSGPFTAVPCYEAALDSNTFCFDISGNPVRLPDD